MLMKGSGQIIRRAEPAEAGILHALTGRSSLHWGYEPEFLEWEPEAIAVTPEFIDGSIVYVLQEGARILGYYALTGDSPDLSLDKLFVEPDRIGTGCGKRLWQHALETARALGAREFTIYSDPNAAPFYRAMGATWEREFETSRTGWHLQVFRMALSRSRHDPSVNGSRESFAQASNGELVATAKPELLVKR